MVVFTEVASSPEPGAGGRSGRPHARGAREAELEQELDHARQELQAIRQEAQMSSEEFRSANEELQSTNEELQSTNEELTTSREEMQSLNEELQTVNHEFQAKMDELSRTSNDMKNLLESIDVAVLFLDSALRVRQFTSQTAKITNMIAGDVGRPITDLASDLFQGVLADDAREVLRTLLSVEKQVEIRNGRWYQVRIMPYRTRDNMIDGVVITFTDITVSKTLEGELRRIQSLLKERIAEQAADLGAAEAKYQAEMRSGGAAGALEGLDKPDGTGGTSR
jgi:two-component system CheB/CheR fusion protein